MIRNTTTPRHDWRGKIEAEGFLFHSVDGTPYWDESVYYQFTPQQVDDLEVATNELHELCLLAVQNVIDNNRFAELQIPEAIIPLIIKSWDDDMPAIYGRFDLRYDGKSPPKMLEYNADTPTSLLEAAVIQWSWLEQTRPGADQFNSIHDRLIAKWRELKPYLNDGSVHFTSSAMLEDFMNITYMRDVASQAGIQTKTVAIDDIGWNSKLKRFVDTDDELMSNVFKLYPWEWLINEEFGQHIAKHFESTIWVEPPWKLILSNKGILPILWELNPGHENLLPAFFDNERTWAANEEGKSVRKPLYSREGANISVMQGDVNVSSTGGEYGEEGYVYQSFCPLPEFDGKYPVIGSWVIDGVSAGIGIREADTLITGNTSRFVPHVIA